MEAKLRAMESRLRLDGGGAPGAGSPALGGPVAVLEGAQEQAPVSFHFKEGLPSAADFNRSLKGAAGGGLGEEPVAVNGVNGAGH